MEIVLVYAALLVVAVLVSERASRSVLSTSVLFLVGGALAGSGGIDWVRVQAGDPAVERFVELTLFAVLFTDAMRAPFHELRSAWRLPGRALLLGMPLSFGFTALLAHGLAGLAWPDALLVGAVLAPTDPVFASALVGREEVPARLRHLLNVESGLNDGLALPAVVLLIGLAGSNEESVHAGSLLGELAAGIGIGVAVPWVVLRGRRALGLGSAALYEPLLSFAIALVVWALTALLHANPFLGAFAAGVTVASVDPEARRDFERFGSIVGELLKLGALLLLGALVDPAGWSDIGLRELAFAGLVLVAARPLAVFAALAGSGLDRPSRVAAAWFGPKGFASVAYALLVLRSGLADAVHLYHVLVLVIAISIVLHSSSDVLVARWFRAREQEDAGAETGTTA